MHPNPAIIDFIIDQVRSMPAGILGAQLGMQVIKHFPEVFADADYRRGLKNYVAKYCDGQICIELDACGDNIYKAAQYLGQTPSKAFSETVSIWAAFQNPYDKHALLFDKTNLKISVSKLPAEEKEGVLVITKVTDVEHREIANKFTSEIQDETAGLFKQALAEDIYWPHWMKVLSKTKIHTTRWMAFRFEEICRLFISRLEALGIDGSTAKMLLEHVVENKRQVANKLAPRSLATPMAAGSGSVVIRNATRDIHSIAHAVIDRLTDSEVRSIWMPIGVVVDAVNANHG